MNNKNFKFKIDERNIQLILNRIKTNSKLKWILILGFVLIPYTLFWVLFGGNESNFFLWLNQYDDAPRLAYVIIDYGMQWLIAVVWAIVALFSIDILSKKNKDIKKDVYFSIVGWTFVMINFWLIPIGLWTLLLAIPFYVCGVAIVIVIQIFLFMKNYQKNLQNMQDNFPDVFNQQNNQDEIKIEDHKKDKDDKDNKKDDDQNTIDIK
ncbi:MAG: hypothetical protein HPPSJP_4490 [Candidatus Hepatoplasma scabrum]|nr:MAG: hypothetical protein HPPSJP_4490 [Candidatus Hepatoplasma sp.]